VERDREVLIEKLALDIDKVGVDDIVVSLAGAYTGLFYALINLITERWGADAAQELARQLGRRNGERNLTQWLKSRDEPSGSPALMAAFQDYQHAMRGPDHAAAISDYDDDKATVDRDRCAWHSRRPDGTTSYCRFVSEGIIEGYGAADPGVSEIRIQQCMSWGDAGCRHEFWYSRPDHDPEREHPRARWQRPG
jgi:hypothetical protein